MVCRIKNRHTFKSLPILNSAYFTECRFVIHHITQTDTETETEANFTHITEAFGSKKLSLFSNYKVMLLLCTLKLCSDRGKANVFFDLLPFIR